MTPNKHWFSDFKPLEHGKVFMGNNHVCEIKGIGNVFIKMHDGVTRKLTEVRYVPDLRRNLISLGIFDTNGFSNKSENGIMKDGLYHLIRKTVFEASALVSKTVPEKTLLWHRRIGHIMTKSNLWIFVTTVYLENSIKSVFQLAHTSPLLSLIICTVIYGGLKRFQLMVGMTVRHNLQQNGVAERMNRTMMDKVRCLLVSLGIPKPFWGEAVSTAVYLINRSPSTAINFKTPLELWSGEPPNLSNLRVFGCAAFAHQKEVEGRIYRPVSSLKPARLNLKIQMRIIPRHKPKL
ncbi:hypothetical protein M9H77_19142 [Catharanthus roseus]|uniref:Uncharacterized protein n=1 Tax=Catharanthus roseus TaxID=4058 RepID=A0ACC0B9F5_CATRO|nr:hypothetical protein M9H77_00591 [Catharanthus roseus]KAI5669289.1 hypothetical protein M9H77_19142 [Catharanthus roseus]